MTPSLGAYLGGCLALIALATALGFGGYWLRRWIVPDFTGSLARLAEATIAIAILILVLQLLGALQLFELGWIVGGSIAAGLIAGAAGRRWAPRDVKPIRPPALTLWPFLIAIGVASFTVAEWSFPSQLSLDQGMFGGDSTWYHMPFSARFVQDAAILPLHFTDPLRLAVWFYPQSYELLDGGLMAIFQSDWLSPLFNLGWLAMGLLAAWCVGRPYAVAPATLVAAALVFDSGVLIETQAGQGRNDIMAYAFLAAFAAFLINGHQRRAPREGAVEDLPERDVPLLDRGPLILAGLAGGIAISAKLTMLAPIGAILVGMVLVSGTGRRWTTLWVTSAAMAVTGAFWYVRAAIYSGGNPTPQISFGPLNLPTPDQMPIDPRPRFSVADYLFDPAVYRAWFFPRLDDALGPLFPLILVVAFAACGYLVFKSRNRIVRLLAAGALLTAIVYIFTPLTAAGPEGQPRGFFTNTRYLMPGLLLGLMLVPIARPLRSTPLRTALTLGFFTAVYAITVLTTPWWIITYLAGAVFLTLALVWAPVGLAWLHKERRIGRVALTGGVVAMLVLAVVLGRAQQEQFSEQAYADGSLFLDGGGPTEIYEWAHGQSDRRIAVAGSGAIFFAQYGLYGGDRSNHVQYIGVEGDTGAYRLATTCERFKREINEGGYDFLALTEWTQDSPDALHRYPVHAWVENDPALRLELAEEDAEPQPAWIYALRGDLDPTLCAEVRVPEQALTLR